MRSRSDRLARWEYGHAAEHAKHDDRRAPAAQAEKFFTAEEANRSLVLVRKVVADIVEKYQHLLDLRARRNDTAAAVSPAQVRQLQEEVDTVVDELNRLHDELAAVGCILKDWSAGLVDFPALYRGRKIWLCWRLGEPAVTHWHELYAGFAGRCAVGPDFD